jgi:hypothetical protein
MGVSEVSVMKAVVSVVACFAVSSIPIAAQEVTGQLGSPSATTTIGGEQ